MRMRVRLAGLGVFVVVGMIVLYPSPLKTRHLNTIRSIFPQSKLTWQLQPAAAVSSPLNSSSSTTPTVVDTRDQVLANVHLPKSVPVQEPPVQSIPSPHLEGDSIKFAVFRTDNGTKFVSTEKISSKFSISTLDHESQKIVSNFPNSLFADNIGDNESESGDDLKMKAALEYSKKTLDLVRRIEDKATPANFVDVPKVGALPKPASSSNVPWHENPDEVISPARLRERAAKFPPDSAIGRFMAEQSRRVEHIGRQCAMSRKEMPHEILGYEASVMAINAYAHLIFDRRNSLTFCPVYKAASTSWSNNLLQLSGLVPSKRRQPAAAIQNLLGQVFPRISGIAGPSLTKDTIKFMVVRHPFERLVSCYRDKFQDGLKDYYYEMYGEKMVHLYRPKPPGFSDDEIAAMLKQVRNAVLKHHLTRIKGNPYSNPIGPTFPEFVQFIINARQDDEHWRPYYTHCAACYIKYHAILRFETLYDESIQFIEYLNRTGAIEPRWDNISSQGASTSAVACSLFKQLTVNLVQKLLQKYAKDFIYYEYQGEEYLKCAKDYKEGMTADVRINYMNDAENNTIAGVPAR
ncbi:uncharacterized protein LOC108679561 [Hyalella azteca]|uniref:Carbohydrate sulfotransferase n=1 Tax=Hyalella azteca TaxID=294128 RepID=A0A8B7PEH3_HYAAZ|nr:uncharacterized protein LOC108679561 [Hyalella azteca]